MDNPETLATLCTCIKTQDENKQKPQKTVEQHEPHQRSGVCTHVSRKILYKDDYEMKTEDQTVYMKNVQNTDDNLQ